MGLPSTFGARMGLMVGLTGGIGSGKSTVARLLALRGAEVIDADQLAREVVAPGEPAFAEITRTFGPEVLDAEGRLDRGKLGALVFSDTEARSKLNAIVHPEVARLSAVRMSEALARGRPIVVYDVPLLYENHLESSFPVVVVVDAPESIQEARIQARDGLSRAEARARMSSQMSLAEKAAKADFVVDNAGRLEDTERQVDELYAALLARADALGGGP